MSCCSRRLAVLCSTATLLLSSHLAECQTTQQTAPGQTKQTLQQRNFISLSAGTPPPLTTLNMSISNAGPGASAVGQTPGTAPFTAGANYGDLSLVSNGQPALAILGLRVQGDISYQVLMSQLNFTANNLQYRGVDVSGNSDRGSFIRILAGTPISASPNTNIQGTTINPALSGEGLALSQIAYGPATLNFATLVFSGASPTTEKKNTSGSPFSISADGIVIGNSKNATSSASNQIIGQVGSLANGAGTGTGSTANAGNAAIQNQALNTVLGAMTPQSVIAQSMSDNPTTTTQTSNSSNALGTIDVPVYFQAPTGFALGPITGPAPGIFTTQLQFSIFPQP